MNAYIITLLQSNLALEIAEESLSAAKKFKINAEIYPAVLGYDSQPLFDRYGITHFLNYTIYSKPGHRGCFLSHFELWLKCVELNEPILILEHDGIFIRPLPDDILENFEDVLRLDAYDRWKPNYNQLVSNSLSSTVSYNRRPTECYYHSNGHYYVGAYGYIIKPKAAEKLIKFSKERGIICTEAQIGTKIVDIVSVTATIVKLHEHYVDRGVEDSATDDLSKIIKGTDKGCSLKYISPSNYKKIYGNFD